MYELSLSDGRSFLALQCPDRPEYCAVTKPESGAVNTFGEKSLVK